MGETAIRGRVGSEQPHESAELHVSGEAPAYLPCASTRVSPSKPEVSR